MNRNIAELFDDAIAKLEKRDTKAYSRHFDSCLYRDDNDQPGCLFGQMITDEHYQPTFDPRWDEDEDEGVDDGENICNSSVLTAIEQSTGIRLFDYLSSTDLNILQSIHDDSWQPGQLFRPLIPEEIAVKIWGKAGA